MSAARLGRLFASALGAGVLALVVACSSASTALPGKPAGRAAPDATATARAQAVTRALTAYNGYLNSYVRASRTADWKATEIDAYVADPLRSQIHQALFADRQQGVVMVGKPAWHPVVTEVEVATEPYVVMLRDCFDTTNWRPIVQATGKSALAPGQLTRYVATAKAELYADGSWYIQQVTSDRSTRC